MRHFTIDELSASATAKARGIPNDPPPEARRWLEELVASVLDPLREAWGGPIRVNSGYRCPRLNEAVGGAKGSQHMLGQAADITVGSREANRRLFDLAISLGLPYDQLIDERRYQWLHISHRRGHNRGQVLHL